MTALLTPRKTGTPKEPQLSESMLDQLRKEFNGSRGSGAGTGNVEGEDKENRVNQEDPQAEVEFSLEALPDPNPQPPKSKLEPPPKRNLGPSGVSATLSSKPHAPHAAAPYPTGGRGVTSG